MGFSFEADISELKRTARSLSLFNDDISRAIVAVTNALLRQLPTKAKTEIRSIYAIPAGKLSEGLKTNRAPDAVELIGSGKGISLITFSGRYGGRSTPGATVQVTKARGRATIVGSFVPKTIPQIFERQRLPSGGRVGRYPIIKAWGPSTAQMLKNENVIEGVVEEADLAMSTQADKLVLR